MAAPIRNTMPPIHVRTPPVCLVNPPSSQRGIRIATVPGTKTVKRSVFRIGQNLGDTVLWASLAARQPAQRYCKIQSGGREQRRSPDSSRVDPDNSIHIFPHG